MVARYIDPGESVLDIGAGACGLSDELPVGCVYWPVDAWPAHAGVGHLDLATARDDHFGRSRFDVAVLSGVLEHVADAERAIRLAALWARRVVLTYSWACDEHRPAEVAELVSCGQPTAHWRCLLAADAREVFVGDVRLTRLDRWHDHAVYEGRTNG